MSEQIKIMTLMQIPGEFRDQTVIMHLSGQGYTRNSGTNEHHGLHNYLPAKLSNQCRKALMTNVQNMSRLKGK